MTREPNRTPLTKELTIRALKPRARDYIVWDATSALGVKVTPTGTKSYLVAYQHDGRTRWYHLGRHPAVPLSRARRNAGEVKAMAALGRDPQGEKVAARERHRTEISFSELAREYLAAKTDMRSIAQYERSLRVDTLPVIG